MLFNDINQVLMVEPLHCQNFELDIIFRYGWVEELYRDLLLVFLMNGFLHSIFKKREK